MIFITVVVDDILVTVSDLTWFDWLLTVKLRATYKISELGEPTQLVGLSISHTPTVITINQNQFVHDLITKINLQDYKPTQTSTTTGDVVTVGDSPHH